MKSQKVLTMTILQFGCAGYKVVIKYLALSKIDDNSFDMHKKLIIDFFMISYASEIFLFYTEHMYNSGFPRLAAWINSVPFKEMKF